MNCGPSPRSLIIDATQGLTITPGNPFLLRRARFSHTGIFTTDPTPFPSTPALLIYVHGYNETPEAARGYGLHNIGAGYREAGGQCEVATFLWCSRFGALHFRESLESANATAPVFARAMTNLRAAAPGHRLHVLAHSLGTRVVLKAVQDHGVTLDDAAFVSPAIHQRAFEPGEEFADAPGRIERLLFTQNRADRILRWYRYFWGPALGQLGLRPSANAPTNFSSENMELAWKDHPSDGGHGAILHPRYWPPFWKALAARNFFSMNAPTKTSTDPSS